MIENFDTVPTKLVRAMLEQSDKVASQAEVIGNSFISAKNDNRKSLEEIGFINKANPIHYAGLSSAIDGSLVIDKKSLGDLAAAAAVVAPYSKDKLPDEANVCDVKIDIIPRSSKNNYVVGALMSLMEIKLAYSDSISDLLMIDGSFVSTIMNIYNGLTYLETLPDQVNNPLIKNVKSMLGDEFNQGLLKVLTDEKYFAFPKYSTTNELELNGIDLKSDNGFDVKSQLSFILQSGEVSSVMKSKAISPTQMQAFDKFFQFGDLKDDVFEALNNIYCVYFKPHPFSPSIRIDFSGNRSISELNSVLSCVSQTMKQPDILEPLPLFMADRWAKSISYGAGAAIDAASVSKIEDPSLKVLFAMSYRT